MSEDHPLAHACNCSPSDELDADILHRFPEMESGVMAMQRHAGAVLANVSRTVDQFLVRSAPKATKAEVRSIIREALGEPAASPSPARRSAPPFPGHAPELRRD